MKLHIRKLWCHLRHKWECPYLFVHKVGEFSRFLWKPPCISWFSLHKCLTLSQEYFGGQTYINRPNLWFEFWCCFFILTCGFSQIPATNSTLVLQGDFKRWKRHLLFRTQKSTSIMLLVGQSSKAKVCLLLFFPPSLITCLQYTVNTSCYCSLFLGGGVGRCSIHTQWKKIWGWNWSHCTECFMNYVSVWFV